MKNDVRFITYFYLKMPKWGAKLLFYVISVKFSQYGGGKFANLGLKH